jgi:RNA polymerase sigma-70 factor (ECF subfamily)
VDESLNAWFKREILVHEAALVRYLTRAWRNRDEIHDLRQEVYIRVYEAAKTSRPHSPKSFMFTTARHLMTDRARRGRVVSIEAVGDADVLNVLVDEISPERNLHARQELKKLAQAFGQLPPKCREVVWLRRVDELSQKEVAKRLGISPRTVESHVMKGMRLLADMVFGGNTHDGQSANAETFKDSEHGNQRTD